MPEIIKVAGLSKSYGDFLAVDDVSFSVGENQLFAFLGPNGAGKSTTINMICTLLDRDKGDIVVDGHLVGKEDGEIRKKLGIVFQNGVLDPLLTVRENIRTRGALYGLYGEELEKRIRWASDAAGTEEFLDRPYGKLSGGQRRRSDIARALVSMPRILMLDEPTTGLDPQTRKSVWKTILKLKEDGMTVFLTTHYMEEAEGADQVVVINRGRIAAVGTPSDLKERYSSDILVITSKNIDSLRSALDADSVTYCMNGGGRVKIELSSTRDSIELISRYRDYIDALEVKMGTMDDAFINITGEVMI